MYVVRLQVGGTGGLAGDRTRRQPGGGATAFGAKFPFLHLLPILSEEVTWAPVYPRVAVRGGQLVQVRVTAAPRAPEAEAVGSGGLAPSFMIFGAQRMWRPVGWRD